MAENIISGTHGDLRWAFSPAGGLLRISGTGRMKIAPPCEDFPWFDLREGIRSISVGEGVTFLPRYAFADCQALTEVRLPASLRGIAGEVFFRCRSLTALTVAEGNPALRAVDGVLYTADRGILLCCPPGRKERLELPDSVTRLSPLAFRGCRALTAIRIPAALTELAPAVFSGCRALTEISVAEGNPTFRSVDGLLYTADGRTLLACPPGREGAVEIPEGVTEIAGKAFGDCRKLTAIHIPAAVTKLGPSVFSGCRALTEISVAEGNPAFRAVDGLLCSADGRTLLHCPEGKEGELAIPEGVTEIAAKAFGICLKLTAIRIPAGCTALEGAGFPNCLRLKAFSVAEGNPAFRAADGVLYSADGGTLLLCPPGHDETLEIPEGVTAIAAGALSFCLNLRCLRIPMGLKGIEPGAFRGCFGVERVMLYRGGISLLLHRGIPIRE